MWARLRNVISLTLLTAVKAVPRKPWCFELFGFDIMLDEALKPWLIEVNCSPALGTTEKADYAVKEPLLKDMMHLLEMKPVDFSKRNNKECLNTILQLSFVCNGSCVYYVYYKGLILR